MNHVDPATHNDEARPLDYVKVILRNRMLVCCIVGVSVLATAVVSLLMTPIYEAKAVIMPIESQGGQSGMSSIAAQLGVGGLGVGGSSYRMEIVGLLKSNLLRERVIRKYQLIPLFFKGRSLQHLTEDERIWMALRFLNKAMKVASKQKDNTIEIVFVFRDRETVADLVNYVLVELADHISSEEKRVAEVNRQHLESTIDRTADPVVKTSIYNLIAKQVEKSAMAEATENFAFKIIDPPRVPDQRISPQRRQMLVVSFVVSLFLGILGAFGKEYVTNHKDQLWLVISELARASGLQKKRKRRSNRAT
jgi:uncharacterized protein involved in exopolysaccharide biosynthesis